MAATAVLGVALHMREAPARVGAITSPPVLRSGCRVRVWWSHPDRTGLEGTATIVSRVHEPDVGGWEVWWVRFKGCSDEVERIVHPNDLTN